MSNEGGGSMGSYLVKHAKCFLLIALFYEEKIRCAYLLSCNKFVNQSYIDQMKWQICLIFAFYFEN